MPITRYVTRIGEVAPQTKVQISSQNIQFQSIPHKIFVFARQRNTDRDASPTSTDTFFNISRVSVQFNNSTGLLSTASEKDLYDLSVSNGLKQTTFEDWSGSTKANVGEDDDVIGLQGSVLCIAPGADLELEEYNASGQTGNYSFTIDLDVTNPHVTQTINADLYIVAVQRGVLCNQKDAITSASTGLLSSDDIKRMEVGLQTGYSVFQDSYGGFLPAALMAALPLILSGISQAPQLIKSAKDIYKAVKGGEIGVGGAKMDKKTMKDRMMRL